MLSPGRDIACRARTPSALNGTQRRHFSTPETTLSSGDPRSERVYKQKAGQKIVEYDKPSSLFGQFGEKNVTDVALALDTKLERALAQAAELARR